MSMARRWTTLVCCGVIFAAPAHAVGPYFLTDTPMSRFTAADREIFQAAAEDALNNAADGEQIPWQNPDSTARGVITPLETVQDEIYGLCRRVRVTNERRGNRRSGTYRACKSSNGTWRLHSAGDGAER